MPLPPELTPRPALPGDAAALTHLAMTSKAHWGYDAAFMEACREELSVTGADIAGLHVHLIEHEGAIAGAYALSDDVPEAELCFIFVAPAWIGHGIGRRLMDHMKALALRRGVRRVVVDSDPNAEAFYVRMGGRRIGMTPSGSIEGRFLAQLAFDIGDGA